MDKLNTVITALLQHMGNPDHAYASILPCVRTLVMLTDHDYGFYNLVKYVFQFSLYLALVVSANVTRENTVHSQPG